MFTVDAYTITRAGYFEEESRPEPGKIEVYTTAYVTVAAFVEDHHQLPSGFDWQERGDWVWDRSNLRGYEGTYQTYGTTLTLAADHLASGNADYELHEVRRAEWSDLMDSLHDAGYDNLAAEASKTPRSMTPVDAF